jgi:hypothetical protein
MHLLGVGLVEAHTAARTHRLVATAHGVTSTPFQRGDERLDDGGDRTFCIIISEGTGRGMNCGHLQAEEENERKEDEEEEDKGRQDPATPTVPVAGAAISAEGVIIAVVHHD